MDKKKIVEWVVFFSVAAVTFILIQKFGGKLAGEAYWKAEQEHHNKRLFGDAWKDV